VAKSLALFVEGADDRRFVERVLRPRMKKATYSALMPIEYAQMEDSDVNGLVSGFNASTESFDYLFLTDRDTHQDITACKRHICRKYPAVKPENVVMVCAEIESWYVAGLTPSKLAALGIRFTERTTDTLTKERFNAAMPLAYRKSRRVFLIKMLDSFTVSTAKGRNASFKSFCLTHQAVVSKT